MRVSMRRAGSAAFEGERAIRLEDLPKWRNAAHHPKIAAISKSQPNAAKIVVM